MNYLTGASACMRKAIYELLVHEKAEGEDYTNRIKFLKTKYPDIESTFFDILAAIKDMTSEKVHEQSWPEWDSHHITLILEALKEILHEIYVIPDEKKKGTDRVRELQARIAKGKMSEKIDSSKESTE